MFVVFIGNCQSRPLARTLNLNCHVEVVVVNCNKLNRDEFENLIKQADVIISQPISGKYNYLSTENVIKHKNKNCKIILYHSCYFTFYHFDIDGKLNKNS